MTRRDLTRWNPFSELRTMRNMWDTTTWPFGNDGQMDLDVYDKDGMLYVEADIPGVAKEDVEVSINEGILTIRAQHTTEREVKEEAYYLRECRSGMISRSIRLPPDVDTAKIDASQKDGHLTITMPRTHKLPTKKIEIHEA